MADCFRKKYATYYDLIYKDKNYGKECDYLEGIFRKFLGRKPKTILDMACGTGGHAIPLAERGYEVTGLDTSKAMLEIARKKKRGHNQKAVFYVNRMQDFKINKKFDVVISMFSTIDYLTNQFDLKRMLLNVKNHLKKRGLFIFDFWNGFAMIDHYDPKKLKIEEEGDIRIERVSLTNIDIFAHLAKVKFKCTIFKKGKLKDKVVETHSVRFFFPEEIKNILEDNGFKIAAMYPFLSFRKKLAVEDWDITAIATPFFKHH